MTTNMKEDMSEMTFHKGRLKALAILIGCIAAALAFSACGGTDSTSGGSTESSESNSPGGSSAQVKQAEEKVAEARKPLSTFTGPTEPAGTPPAGKTVALVKVLPVPFPNHQAEGAEAAIEAAGWSSRVFTADGTPHGFETAMSSALASKPDAIFLLSMPAALMQPQLEEAKKEGVEVIAFSPGLPPGKTPEEWNLLNQVGYDAQPLGETLADWVIQAAPEGAEAIALSSPEFVDLQTASKAFQEGLTGAGSKYSIAEVVDSPVTDSGGGQTGVNRLASPMRKHPDANYMFINSESWVSTFLQASQAAGRTGEVTGLGTDGDVSIPLIKEGQRIVMMGSAAKTYGWYAVDALIRKWNGKPQQEYDIPLVLVDSENADEFENEYIEVTYDVAAEWEKLWGKG